MSSASKREAAAFVLALAIAFALGSAALEHWVGVRPPKFTRHKNNIFLIPHAPSSLPKPEDGPPSVLLVANSHAYSLPGLQKGDSFREDVGVTLLDELGSRVDTLVEGSPVRYYRLSYPNFLPVEMMTRLSQMLRDGYKPTVVVIGWAWANIARDRGVRKRIADTYRIPGVSEDLLTRLARPEVAAPPELLEAIRAEQRAADAVMEEERGRSHADHMENAMRDWAEPELVVLDRSSEIRAKIYRDFVMPVQDTYSNREAAYVYDALESDLAFNRAAMLALIRWLHSEGIYVYAYFTPQRPNMSPLVDPTKEEEVMAEFTREAQRLGFTVIDARRVIPDGDELWGWAGEFPDRSHFTEPGHRILAEFIAEKGRDHGVWNRLRERRADR